MSPLRAPLLQFFLLGALLLLAYRALKPPPKTQITLTAEALAGFEKDFQRRHGRPPSEAERQAQRESYLDSEVLYREALSRHLDRGDVIIRRRLIQKMEFVLDALVEEEAAPLSSQALSEFYAQHAERYRQPARFSLVQVFVAASPPSPTVPRTEPLARAQAIRQRLLRGAEPGSLGDPFIRGTQLREQSESELAAIFGPTFAASVATLPVGSWSEPIASSYGLHAVQLTAPTPQQQPALPSVRARVESDLRDERRQQARRDLLRTLRQSYRVVQP